MFEWLAKEIASIKTKRFHVIGRGLDAEDRKKLENVCPDFPPSYLAFLRKFGEARLYRSGGGYDVIVKGLPEKIVNVTHGVMYFIGWHDDEKAFFFADRLVAGEESPVYQLGEAGFHMAAGSFAEWLQAACHAARMRYNEDEWRAILKGPPPWTRQERAILERRRGFECALVGVSVSGGLLFKVTNHSQGTLPFLSIGLRSKQGTLEGGAWLPTGHLRPGETAIIEKQCYQGLIPPDDLELVPLPDPEPEDRARYWEFRGL
jgi:hypothetical protein